jgi:uncharacterized protein (TIGR03545 family)
MNKPQKLPNLFRKPLNSRKLNKKILKRIYIESERTFLLSKLEEDKNGLYSIDPSTLNKAEFKRLRLLAKSIKKNKGLVTSWKAGLVVLILAVTLAFNYLLKDRLIEQVAERYLQQVFKAKVDLQEPQLKLLSGTISFDRLIIADAEQPMQNLVEIGSSNLALDTGRLLSRKFIIREAACREIRFHTPRSSSGALDLMETAEFGPNEDGRSGEQVSEAGAITQMGALGLEIGEEAGKNLIEAYKASLESPALIESANRRYRESRRRWEDRSASVESTVETVQSRTDKVLETDVSSIDNVSEARTYFEQLQGLKQSVQAAQSEAQAAYEEFQADTGYIRETRESINAAIENDIEFLEESVGSFSTDSLEVFAETAEPILRERFGKIFDYGERITRTYRQLKSTSTSKKSRFEDSGRSGTVVRFPMQDYPKFLLEHFEVSTGAANSSNFSEFIIRNLTGDQDTLGKPTTIAFSTAPEAPSLESDLVLDARENSAYLLESTTVLTHFPIELPEGLNSVPIDSLTAQSDTDLAVSIQPDLSGKGTAAVRLYDIKFAFGKSDSELARAIREILGGIDSTDLKIDFEFSDGNISALTVESELDSLLSDRIADYAEQRAGEAAEQIEGRLYEYLEDELAVNEKLSEDLRSVGAELLSDVRTAENLEQLVEKEQQKVEAEIRKIQDEVKDKAGDAIKDLGSDLNLPGF